MDNDVLHSMAATAARGAARMCERESNAGLGVPFQSFIGYLPYVEEYNRILLLAAEINPEIARYFSCIDLRGRKKPSDLRRRRNPFATGAPMWRYYSELALVRLESLATYLNSKLDLKEREHEQIADLLTAHLRPSIYQDPADEREVQNVVETIFRARSLDFQREKDSVPFSTKRYVPDFTFNRIGLAVEIKYCKDRDREGRLIDEINADIAGYAPRYERMLFIVYDLGFIRDVPRFSEDIEKNPNVKVLVIKK